MSKRRKHGFAFGRAPILDKLKALIVDLTSDELQDLFLYCYKRLSQAKGGYVDPNVPMVFTNKDQMIRDLLQKTNMQAIALTAYSAGIPPILSDEVPAGDVFLSSGGVKFHEQAGFVAGIDYTLDKMKPFEEGVRGLIAALNQITGYAGCDDGPNTRHMVAMALESFAASMQAIDTAQRMIQAEQLIAVGLAKGMMELCTGIREKATAYAAAQQNTGQFQAALRAYVVQYQPELERQLYAAIDESKKRGRKKGQADPVTRSAMDALDAARRALGIPESRDLQYGEIDDIKRQAVHTMRTTIRLTKEDRAALDVISRADRTYLSNLMNRDKTSPKLNSGDESGLDAV